MHRQTKDQRATDNPDPETRAYPQRPIVSAHAVVFRGDSVLLARRAHEPSWGRWILPGGGIELGETICDAAQREVREETGLNVPGLSLCCILHVDEGADRPGVLVFIFVGHTGRRDVVESSEGTLHWVPLTQINELNLIPDLPVILERVLALPGNGQPLFARSVISLDHGIWEMEFNPQEENQGRF